MFCQYKTRELLLEGNVTVFGRPKKRQFWDVLKIKGSKIHYKGKSRRNRETKVNLGGDINYCDFDFSDLTLYFGELGGVYAGVLWQQGQ